MSHITRLQAENIKKLVAIDIRPGTGAGVVPIRGRNAQGKSSTLDAIMMALGGAKFTPSQPIRTGEDEGAIRLELDDGQIILRRFTRDGNDTIEVTNGEGFKAGSPQAVLNKLFASVAFDPLAFTRLKPAEQLATLRGLVKLDVDVDALTKANTADYDTRRDTNRELEREQGRLRDMPTFADVGDVKRDETALEETIAGAAAKNGELERRRINREDFAAALDRNRARLVELEEEARQLAATIEEHRTTIGTQEKQLADAEPLPEPVDVSQAQADLRDARETNRKIDANAAAATQQQLVDALDGRSDALTTRMDDRKKQIVDAIGRAEMPVPGLGFGEGEVLFGGVPLEQASSAEQLRVSTAIGIASAPKLRVMLVRDGSLLDDEGQRILAELAEQHDFQLWVEAVDASGKVGIVLEDGAVASIDGEAAPEPEPIAAKKRRAKKPAEETGSADSAAQPATAGLDVGSGESRTVIARVEDEKVTDFRVVEQGASEADIARAVEDLGGDPAELEDMRPAAPVKPAAPSLFD